MRPPGTRASRCGSGARGGGAGAASALGRSPSTGLLLLRAGCSLTPTCMYRTRASASPPVSAAPLTAWKICCRRCCCVCSTPHTPVRNTHPSAAAGPRRVPRPGGTAAPCQHLLRTARFRPSPHLCRAAAPVTTWERCCPVLPPAESRLRAAIAAPPQGRGAFYDLETLLFFAQRLDLKFTEYFKAAGREIGKQVTFVDRKVRPAGARGTGHRQCGAGWADVGTCRRCRRLPQWRWLPWHRAPARPRLPEISLPLLACPRPRRTCKST